MPALKYKVRLTEEEKAYLEQKISKGKMASRSHTRARILLKAHEGWQDGEIIRALNISDSMVYKTRLRFVEAGLEAALRDRPRPGKARKLNDKQAATIIATACSDPPTGHDHWTLRLLADKVVELAYAESCSYETIRQLLKKHLKSVAETGVVYSRGER